MYSKRINNIRVSSIMKYNDIVSQREKKGIHFYKANMGQPNFESHSIMFESLAKYSKKINDYTSPKGIEKLRENYALYVKAKIKKDVYSADNIIITQGASDGIIKILYCICDEQDEILILEPFFSDYKIYCDILNIKIKSIDYEEENYGKYITNKTKAVLFSNPNNPDGRIISKKQITKLIRIANENDIFIISDEVYGEILYTNKYNSLLKEEDKHIIIVDSASKKLNACGSRIGFVISNNKELLDKITILNDSKISISNIEQYVVNFLLQKHQEISKSNTKCYKDRMNLISKLLKNSNIDFNRPMGGITMLLSLPIRDAEKYVEWLASTYESDGYSLLLTSANDFYTSEHGKNKIRLSLTINDDDIENMVEILLNSIKEYQEVENND